MELNRLLEIAAERAICDLCADCGNDACIACTKVKGVTATELREYHAAVRNALRRTAEDDKAREEGRFAPGRSVYVVERDECGEAAEVTGCMFLAVSGQGAILSCFINDMEGLEETIGDHIIETAENMSTDLYVYPIEDVYSTRQDAEAALGGGEV